MEITLYSNYYSSEREQATREFIFDSRADDNPDWEMVYYIQKHGKGSAQ